MKYLTIFSDIHANLPALEAVIADMDRRGLENRYCLGDLVGYGTYPNEVVVAIRNSKISTIIGNYDQGIGNSSDDCGCAYRDEVAKALGQRPIAWTNEHTTGENKTYLRQLPRQLPLPLGEFHVLLVHGSPRRVNEYLYEDRPASSLERLLDLAEADVLVCGHTHLPYHRILPSGRHVVNVGSVGKPKDGDPRACYVALDADGSDFQVQFIRIPYDIEAAVNAIEASEMPDEYAQMLLAGKG
jgi:putative phosphoesterase